MVKIWAYRFNSWGTFMPKRLLLRTLYSGIHDYPSCRLIHLRQLPGPMFDMVISLGVCVTYTFGNYCGIPSWQLIFVYHLALCLKFCGIVTCTMLHCMIDCHWLCAALVACGLDCCDCVFCTQRAWWWWWCNASQQLASEAHTQSWPTVAPLARPTRAKC